MEAADGGWQAASDSAFMRGSDELQTTKVERAQGGAFKIVSGLDNMVILKTAKSGFEGYIKESLTTLPETKDRLFGTAVRAEWSYGTDEFDYDAVRTKIRETMLKHLRRTRQQIGAADALCDGRDALAAVPEITDIELTMPNKHCLLVDLSRFGQDNPNEIFVPTDEPHGYIEARIVRKS